MTATDAPIIRKTPTGWLAVAEPGDHPCIGVQGTTEAEAIERFRTSRQAWRALRELPDRVPTDA